MMGVEDSLKRCDLTKQITASEGNIADLFHSRVSSALCCHLIFFFVHIMYVDLYMYVHVL